MTDIDTVLKAIQLYAEMRPRPSQVTQTQAAEMLCLSRPTVSRLVKSGQIRLNKCGMIPVTEIDRVLATDR
jgi:DNA-binding transcriptional regulator LsrR (DeoR family)